ncbi:MAG: transposase [Cyanobacteria bacterium REEB65]|nr:transposase [Cyanobacteria bacterium REEB65]
MSEVTDSPVSSRRRRYSRDEREAIVAAVRRMRAEGMTMAAVVSEVGVSQMTLAKWLKGSNPAPAFLPVVVGPSPSVAPARGPILVTPSGYRIEGLTIDALLTLLGRLG